MPICNKKNHLKHRRLRRFAVFVVVFIVVDVLAVHLSSLLKSVKRTTQQLKSIHFTSVFMLFTRWTDYVLRFLPTAWAQHISGPQFTNWSTVAVRF